MRKRARVWVARHLRRAATRLDPDAPGVTLERDGRLLIHVGGVGLARITAAQIDTDRPPVTSR